MEKKNNRRKSSRRIGIGGILIRVALILICLILLCVHLMSGLFAKYLTSGEGDDSARVAKFQVNVTGEAKDHVLAYSKSGTDGTQTISVENLSEVAVKYDVTVVFNQLPPEGLTVKIGDKAGVVSGNRVTFSNVGMLPVYTGSPNANTHTLTFLMDWSGWNTDAWANFVGTQTGASAQQTLAFSVTVNVVQVD